MAKNSIRDYSATASLNTDIQSIDIDENCAASGINNAIREVMADLKDVSVGTVALESPSADSLTVTGDLTVDTSTLKVDSTNNRVGIANASPSVELDVTGAAKVSGDLTVDTDTLYVDSTNNRVGVGTTSPDTILHVKSSDSADTISRIENTVGYAANLNLKATGNYSFTTYEGGTKTWLAGQRGLTGGLYSIYDVDNTAHRLVIDGSGNVLVGTTSNAGAGNYKAVINQSSYDGLYVSVNQYPGGHALRLNRNGDGDLAQMFRSGTSVGSISVAGSSTSYNTSSDYRLKENVVANWDATTRLKQLNPVRFNFITDPDTTVDGFLAHEVQSVVPEAISGTHDEVDDDGNPVYQGIDQSKLVPLLVKTIQELEARVAALENA